jgi:preprotein translocase subunit SecA
VPLPPEIQPSKWEHLDPDERAIVIEEQLQDLVTRLYDEREQAWGPEVMRQVERQLMLDVVDQLWVRHLTALDALRDGIGLRAVAQQDPLVAYKHEAHEMFKQLVDQIKDTVVHSFFAVQPMIVREAQAPREMYTNRGETGDGKAQPMKKERTLGRNDPCWCGSGKKYKKCHWAEDQAKVNPSKRSRRPVASR